MFRSLCVRQSSGCSAQDADEDGGVARSYSLAYHPFFRRRGWTPSYPETTGYIITTVFNYAKENSRQDLFDRAVRMADWECEVQMASGAVQGGTINDPPTPAIFNTGQVIFGWVRAYQETGVARYLASALKAGEFLLSVQDADGAWRKSLSKYASAKMPSYTYNTRTAWALLLLGKQTARQAYVDAAVRNIEFALREQLANGWFEQLPERSQPSPAPHHCLCAKRSPRGRDRAAQFRIRLGGAQGGGRATRKAAREWWPCRSIYRAVGTCREVQLPDRERPDGYCLGQVASGDG